MKVRPQRISVEDRTLAHCVSCSDWFGSARAAARPPAARRCPSFVSVIQLFHLGCPAASQGARIKPRAQQLPIYLLLLTEERNKQKISKLEPCLVLHVLPSLKVPSVSRNLFFSFFFFTFVVKGLCFSSAEHLCLDFKGKRQHFWSTGQRRTRRRCK